MKIAVVGSGVSGVGAAWLLSQQHEVVVYEKDDRLGGHTHTIDVPLVAPSKDGPKTTPVDTGFIVCNPATYPNFLNWAKQLDVQIQQSDMSFSVSTNGGEFEWAGTSLSTLFAQRSNLLSLSFHRMIWDMLRFNREGTAFLAHTDERSLSMTLGEYLDMKGYSDSFRFNYLLPMSASIWSTPPGEMLKFPAMTLLRFYHNHRFMQIFNRPQWLTVTRGRFSSGDLHSRSYISPALDKVKDVRIKTPVVVVTDVTGREEIFDHVVLACHGDQSLRLLNDATPQEKAVLGLVKYKANRAVVHRDVRLMPRIRSIWASWNYLAKRSSSSGQDPEVCLTYWMNRLQPFLPQAEQEHIFLTLNPVDEPCKESILSEMIYEHPCYTIDTIKAQRDLPTIQGHQNTWFCGAWTNYGFHEDGLASGLRVAEAIGVKCPFPVVDATHIRSVGPSKL